ncbi:MAG: hypothetical protein QW808_04060 [Desulfurococcaceae archaeon]
MKEVSIVTVMKRKSEGKDYFLLTVPKKVAKQLGLQGKELFRVYIDEKRKRVIYELI